MIIEEEDKITVGDVVTFSLQTMPVGNLTGTVINIDKYPMIQVKVTQGNIIGCTFYVNAYDCLVH